MSERAHVLRGEFDAASAVQTDAVGLAAFVAIFAFVVFLLWGTGFATDDYVHLLQGLTLPLADNLLPKDYISLPLLHYTHEIPFFIIGDRPWAYDLLKAVYDAVSVYFCFCFFEMFCSPRRALVLAFLFVFLPLHDSATYSFTNIYLVLSFSAYLFAYTLGVKGWLKCSALLALLASFSSYGSPPIAFGLAILALMYGRRTAAAALFGPNAIYIVYYLATSLFLRVGTQRLTGDMSPTAIAKQYLLEVVTFIDASVGPSAWAKLYYSLTSLNAVGLPIGILAALLMLAFIWNEKRTAVDRRLMVAATIILLGSFGIFALTGLYPQLAFGLGDRVMIYGSFFLICIFTSFRMPRIVEGGIVALLLLATVGIATHWKDWVREVDGVAANIRANRAIRALPADTLLFVSHDQYSRLGPYAHIEFFTDDYVVQTFFKLQFGDGVPLHLASFNRRLVFEDGKLRDRKYGDVTPVPDGIWLYDSRRNTVEHVDAADIQKRLDMLPDETRHWTQRIPDGWLKERLLQAVPRLRYAY